MKVKFIVVHVSDSPQGRGDNAASIHRWHKARGFDGIGYHRVILEDGTIEQGRPDYWQGAHVSGHNSNSLGVCLIGEGTDATDEQLKSLAAQVTEWLELYPSAKVLGHRDLDFDKECPCFDVRAWWNRQCL